MSSQLISALRTVGIEPTPNLAAFAAIESELRSTMTANAVDARRDFRELVAAGSDAATISAAYETAVTAQQRRAASAAVLAEIEQPLRRGHGRAVAADAADLWAILSDRFAELGAELGAAVAIVGPNPDRDAIAGMGDGAQDALRSYLAVSNLLGHLVGAIKEVAAARRERTPLPMARYVDPEQLASVADIERANACEGGPVYGFAALLAAGFMLRLSTADEYAAVVERVQAAENAARTADEALNIDVGRADVATVRRVR